MLLLNNLILVLIFEKIKLHYFIASRILSIFDRLTLFDSIYES